MTKKCAAGIFALILAILAILFIWKMALQPAPAAQLRAIVNDLKPGMTAGEVEKRLPKIKGTLELQGGTRYYLEIDEGLWFLLFLGEKHYVDVQYDEEGRVQRAYWGDV